MKVKGKNTKKYIAGGILAPSLIQGGLGAAQGIFGIAQRIQANKALRDLEQNRPDLTVPSAAIEYADSPVSQALIQQQADEARRRTSQSISAAAKGGTRALIGALQPTLSGERRFQRQNDTIRQQLQRDALSNLASYQQRSKELMNQQWMNRVAGARGELGASQQNIFGGLGQIGRGANYLLRGYNAMGDTSDTQAGNTPTKVSSPKDLSMGGVSQTGEVSGSESTASGNIQDILNILGIPSEEELLQNISGNRPFKHGGKLKGSFSHSKNPIHMINDKGEKVAEATGGEVILNPDQQSKVAKESSFFKKLLSKFKKEANNG